MSRPDASLGPLFARAACAISVVAACSTSPLKPDAGPTGGAGKDGTGAAGTGAAGAPHDDGAAGATPDGAPGDGGDAPPSPPADRSWIYVATTKGVERIKATGGMFQAFGLAADTRAVFPSPSGGLVAQELTDGRVAVYDGDGSPRATFDIRPRLIGWSDDSTLLFLDLLTKFLQQTSVDGKTRRYLPLPNGVNAYGYLGAVLSPDHSMLAAVAEPYARDNIIGSYLFVLSAVDGTRIRDLGVPRGGGVWTGDNRLFVTASSGQASLVSPRTGATTPVTAWPALADACGIGSWYEPGKLVVGKIIVQPGSDTGNCAQTVLDLSTGATVPSDPGFGMPLFGPFTLSPDDREAAVASNATLSLGAVTGGALRTLDSAMAPIVGIGWAHPLAGTANLVAAPRPPQKASGAVGAPPVASRSGGTNCSTGRWVNRTPNPLPAGWPAPRSSPSFAFDTDRGTLLVEGGLAGNLGTLPNLDYETMEWDGAQGQWTNHSRPDGYGPVMGRAMAYDAHHKVVLAQGADLRGDGPWAWTPELGWKNLRAAGEVYEGPIRVSSAGSVYDLARDRWVVSGGYVELSTWEWDGAAWQRSQAGLPGGTTQAAGARLVYDGKRSRVYSVGNRDRGPSPWLYEPAQNRWTAQPSTGPSPLPRDWSSVAYDARRDRVMVFGGFIGGAAGGPLVGDLSEWDPGTGAWLSCPPTGDAPSARTNAAFFYDVNRDAMVLYGGDTPSGTPATEVWEWYVP